MPSLSSNVRKSSYATNPSNENVTASASARRNASGRAIRPNTTRPANYYARTHGSFNAGATHAKSDGQDDTAPGFFPAVQFFTDAITALPKEVMRQFTLMKEVEAKVHAPNEKLGELIDAIMELPIPPRKSIRSSQQSQGPLHLTSTSAIGSASASVVNGAAPIAPEQRAQDSVSGSINGEELLQHAENDDDLQRRKRYFEIRAHTHSMLPNLDEKNVVLAEANRVLDLQLTRIDSVLPHIDNEISEDSRLGSMTHWAYSDNRKKLVAGNGVHNRAVQATNTLASAASAMHEIEISQLRREGGGEAIKEKGRGRAREHVDSDFDDKPRKTHAKLAKGKAATGLGILTNGEPVKRRKVDKSAPGMERSASGAGKNAKSMKDPPRSVPAANVEKKPAAKAKPGPPKKKVPSSASNSPALVSSPLHNSFNPASIIEPPGNARPQSSRARQASGTTLTNLRYEQLAEDGIPRPEPNVVATNGHTPKTGIKRKAQHELADYEGHNNRPHTEDDGSRKKGDAAAPGADKSVPSSRSESNSGRGGRGSANGTPRTETFPENPMSRSRSIRGLRGTDGAEGSSSEPQRPTNRHQRVASNSHLVKQLASFNRSPDLDDDMSGDENDRERPSLDNPPVTQAYAERQEEAREVERRPLSRRNTMNNNIPLASPTVDDIRVEDEGEDEPMPDAEPLVPELDQVDGNDVEDDEESEHDPDDPNEPRYCYCDRGSFGEMVACDNARCEKEWFHLECTELVEAPGEEETWYCRDCRPHFARRRGGRGGRRGGA